MTQPLGETKGGHKRSLQYCVNPDSPGVLDYLRAVQGHSGGNQIDPSPHDLVVLLDDFTESTYHAGSFTNFHSINRSGIAAGGKDAKKGRQAAFFTAVNPMKSKDHWQMEFNLTKAENCYLYAKLEGTPGHDVLGQLENCSEERTHVLPDTIERDRSLQRSSFILRREGGNKEYWRSHR